MCLNRFRYHFGMQGKFVAIPVRSETHCGLKTVFTTQRGRNPQEIKMGVANSIRERTSNEFKIDESNCRKPLRTESVRIDKVAVSDLTHVKSERAKGAEKASCWETVVQKGVLESPFSSLPPLGNSCQPLCNHYINNVFKANLCMWRRPH